MFDRDLPRPTADVAGRSPTIGGELIKNNPSRDGIEPPASIAFPLAGVGAILRSTTISELTLY